MATTGKPQSSMASSTLHALPLLYTLELSVRTLSLAEAAAVPGASGGVFVYPPAPPGSGARGTRFSVTVDGQVSPVLASAAPSNAPRPQKGKTVSWTSFDTDSTSVTVTV